MESFARRQDVSWRSVFEFRDIEKNVQVHLKNVYSTLSVGLILATVGAYCFQLSEFLQSMLVGVMLISFLTTLGSVLYIYFSPHTAGNLNTRLTAFFVFALATGLGLGPLLHTVSIINPSSIPTAFLGSALIFVSFSLASLFTRKRYYLYLGGALLAAMSLLGSFSLMNLFIQSPAIYQAQLYIGLAIFCAFVVFDTQLIVEKRRAGDTDFIWHALDLFIDFIEIFRHLLIILNSKRNRNDRDD